MISLRDLLASNRLEASAPCRIDSGGTWDIKALALPFEGLSPTTVNISLNLRTSVRLLPFDNGAIKVASKGFSNKGLFAADEIDLSSSFGLFLAAISYFGFHGLEVGIQSGSPVKSAMGGSSTALVALIKVLNKASCLIGGRKMSALEILRLAYRIEDSVSGGNCGLQDHCAAVYGGVNQWNWRYGRTKGTPFERRSLLKRKEFKEFSRHILVAYSGKSHISRESNQKWIRDFLSGNTRAGWIKANEIVHKLAKAIELGDWDQASRMLGKEMALRRELTPECLIPITSKMINQAEYLGCGARFAGAGAGGSLWALGEPAAIKKLKQTWQDTLEPVRNGKVLNCAIDPLGIR